MELEQPHPSPERRKINDEDTRFVGMMLGDLQDNDPNTEWEQIRLNILQHRENTRQQMIVLAEQQLGMSADEAEQLGAEWTPAEEELKALYNSETIRRERLLATMISGVETFIEDSEVQSEAMGVPLRAHQRQAMSAFHEFMLHEERSSCDGKRGLFEMATGTGKTPTFVKLSAALKHNEDPDDPIRILVLVPNNTLNDQTVGRHGRQGYGKFAPHLDIGVYNQYEKDTDHEVTVMTVGSFNELSKRERGDGVARLPECHAVIADEAHMMSGKKTADYLDEFCEGKLAIGLTATPTYEDGHGAYDIFEKEIFKLPFHQSVRNGYLAPTQGDVLNVDPVFARSELPDDPAERHAAMRNAQIKARIKASREIVRKAVREGEGVVIRCPAGDNIDWAVKCAAELRDMFVGEEGPLGRDVLAWHVGGDAERQTKEERDAALNLFNEGRLDVLTYVSALGVGWDSSHAKVFIDVAGANSELEIQQAAGRVTRLSYKRDSNGQRIPRIAKLYSFHDPYKPDKKTVLDILKTRPGEVIEHDVEYDGDEVLPAPRQRRKVVGPTVVDVKVSSIAAESLEHDPNVEPLYTENEVSATLMGRTDTDRISKREAADVLGVSVSTLRQILGSFDVNPDTYSLRVGDLRSILELDEYQNLRVEPLPADSDYQEVKEVAESFPGYVSQFTLMIHGRKDGIHPKRFMKPDGKIGKFYTSEDVLRLQDIISDTQAKIIRSS